MRHTSKLEQLRRELWHFDSHNYDGEAARTVFAEIRRLEKRELEKVLPLKRRVAGLSLKVAVRDNATVVVATWDKYSFNLGAPESLLQLLWRIGEALDSEEGGRYILERTKKGVQRCKRNLLPY